MDSVDIDDMNGEKGSDTEKDAAQDQIEDTATHDDSPQPNVNQIGGQPINSTEQEVIVSLLLAQGQVYSTPTTTAGGNVYIQQEPGSNTVTIVPAEMIQEGPGTESEGSSSVPVEEHNMEGSQESEQEGATAAIMENVEQNDEQGWY